ncbi:ATP-binding protein [soil metagenome]
MITITKYTTMIERTVRKSIEKKLFKGKAIVLIGARQTGKTTLVKRVLKGRSDVAHLNCDEPIVRDTLTDVNLSELKRVVGKNRILFIDEAQRVKNIGLALKLIIDGIEEVQLIVTGSSSLKLADEINEPLTGWKWEYQLFPVSWAEFTEYRGFLEAKSELEQRILYGMYPDVIMNPDDEYDVLTQLSDSYLYKDLLAFKGIRKPELLEKLLQALALQIGNEVSYNELSKLLLVDKNTVARYIDLLEKTSVIFTVPSFSRNMRKEISKGKKIYFYDCGVRNAIISNFNPLELRTDKGALWENFLFSERLKMLRYSGSRAKMYFWRTTDQREVDYVETESRSLKAWEMKWNENTKSRTISSFKDAYGTDINVVTPKNFDRFLEL